MKGRCISSLDFATATELRRTQWVKIIVTQARLRRAEGESDAVNHVRFLYICRALGHLRPLGNEINQGLCYVKVHTRGPCLVRIFATWKKLYYAKFVLVE